jgi:hypothetical protein
MTLRRILAPSLTDIIAVDIHEGPLETHTAAGILVEGCGEIGTVSQTEVSVGAGLPGRVSRGTTAKLIFAAGAAADGTEGTAADDPFAAFGPARRTGWPSEFEPVSNRELAAMA